MTNEIAFAFINRRNSFSILVQHVLFTKGVILLKFKLWFFNLHANMACLVAKYLSLNCFLFWKDACVLVQQTTDTWEKHGLIRTETGVVKVKCYQTSFARSNLVLEFKNHIVVKPFAFLTEFIFFNTVENSQAKCGINDSSRDGFKYPLKK